MCRAEDTAGGRASQVPQPTLEVGSQYQDPYKVNKHSFEHRQMAVLEGRKVKCFTSWGFETPTRFQWQVGRETWLEEEGGLRVIDQIARHLADLKIVTGEAVKESGGRFKQALLQFQFFF